MTGRKSSAAKSTGTIRVLTECRSCRSSASFLRRSSRRAISTRWMPLAASCRAKASPIPDEAPVTTAQDPKRAAKSFMPFSFANFCRRTGSTCRRRPAPDAHVRLEDGIRPINERKGEYPETHERSSSGVDFNIALDLGLTGQDVARGFVLIGQRILDGHRHPTRDQLDATGCACAGTAGVVDGDTGRICRVEYRRIDRNGRG